MESNNESLKENKIPNAEEKVDKELKEQPKEENSVSEETKKEDEKENNSEEAKGEKEEKKLKTSDKVFFIVMGSFVILLSIYLMLFSFVFFHVQVAGRSMDHTLANQDILIANKLKKPKHGDVIIISGLKDSGDWLVKRAIAFEGDVVTIISGDVYLNDELLEEDYAVGKTYAPDSRDDGDIYEMTYVIKEGEIFFLGDNREDSLDSRFYGVCTYDNVEGVIGKGAIKMKGFTTSVNNFIIKLKSKLGFKTGIVRG